MKKLLPLALALLMGCATISGGGSGYKCIADRWPESTDMGLIPALGECISNKEHKITYCNIGEKIWNPKDFDSEEHYFGIVFDNDMDANLDGEGDALILFGMDADDIMYIIHIESDVEAYLDQVDPLGKGKTFKETYEWAKEMHIPNGWKPQNTGEFGAEEI